MRTLHNKYFIVYEIRVAFSLKFSELSDVPTMTSKSSVKLTDFSMLQTFSEISFLTKVLVSAPKQTAFECSFKPGGFFLIRKAPSKNSGLLNQY